VASTLLAGGKSKKDGNLGDSARGQADPGSAAVYTMDRHGPVICMYVLVCVGTVSHPYKLTNLLVVTRPFSTQLYTI
jgi:hypothetical protein